MSRFYFRVTLEKKELTMVANDGGWKVTANSGGRRQTMVVMVMVVDGVGGGRWRTVADGNGGR